MDMNKVTLPPEIQKRCWRYGEHIVLDYDSGWNARSREVSSHGAETNIELQALARMAECAFCIWLGRSIEALNWSRYCDDGYDTPSSMGRVDVKHTKAGRLLIWPVRKNDLYQSKRFDVLVLVIGGPEIFEIAGWISKEAFRQRHQIAPEGHKLFPGTRFMDRDALWPVLKPSDWLPPDNYDATKDVEGSFNEAYQEIRKRIVQGGRGWEPK
jgi:hypothetical protein